MSHIKIIKASELKDKPKQEQVWNKISRAWGSYVVKDIPFVVEFLKDKKGKIIDLGCGTGRNMFANKNLKYYGVDFSKGQVTKAKKDAKAKGIDAKFFVGDASSLNKKIFKTKMFDAGLFIATLHCIEGKENREKAIKEFYRVLKPKAKGIISVWNSEDKRFNCVNNKGDIYMAWRENKIPYMRYYYLYTKKEFLDLVKKTGFKVVKIYEPEIKDRFSKKNLVIQVEK